MDTPDQIALSILEQRNEWLVNGVLKPATLGVLIADTIRAERKQAEQVTADAALVAEMSAMRAELEAARARAERIEKEAHEGIQRLLTKVSRERDAAQAVIDAARSALDAPLFEHRQPLIDALAAYDKAARGQEPR